ncbi:Alpha/beta hydrolase family protein [Saccharopolyspora kobensis]|uniref:Alpha/beta hydrolase family protein n=1 Tax=Saccharopolyspora kobensis TaxID=146035 RepID=A0A1H6EN51_9PSEU|nr:hypothetical protein [Saccharopolyspora kobensis]SEG98229.1 Alpha/beta hydrolase family protein [Saccharopolyspora kobensis]SFE71862.1 Serine aminopeptidase, S33 [Saccharopolyspora kobensis]
MPNSSASSLQLPPPGGPRPVGTRSWHLVDADRADPWDTGRSRELMVQLWYPAGSAGDRARYLPVPVARLVIDSWAEEGENLGAESGEALAAAGVTALDGVPPLIGAPAPLVLLSPGLGEYRTGLSALAEELASRGLWVAGVDHPSDAAGVAFPDGRVVAHHEPDFGEDGDLEDRYLATRIADLRFVLDRLLGSEWRELVDPDRIAVAGHSLGGAAALEVARLDDRVAAAAVLDGSLYGEVLTTGLDVPVLLCALTPPDPDDPDVLAGWEQVWPLLRGPRQWTTVPDAGHLSATDFDVFAAPLGLREPGDPDDLLSFGTLAPGEGVAAVRSVLVGFLGAHLSGHVVADA